MRKEDLKKQIFLESGIVLAGLAIGSGLVFYLGILNEDFIKENRELKTAVNTLSSTTSALLEKYTRVKDSGPLYLKALDKKDNDQLSITREVVKEKFNRFNGRYYLGNTRLVMGGIEEVPDPKYKTPTGTIVTTSVTVSTDALSDEHVYNALNSVLEELPGGAEITRMNLTRVLKLDENTLRIIGQNGTASVVKGDIAFRWYGIKFTETPNDTAADAKKPAP